MGILTTVLQPAAAQTYAEGERVLITGVVTDRDGAPLPGLRVILEASHRPFGIPGLTRGERRKTRRTAQTDGAGKYTLKWYWNAYYTEFELLVGLMVRVPEGEQFYTLERLPLRLDSEEGGPARFDVRIRDTGFLRRYRGFVAGLRTDDQRSVYQRMGIPAKVDRLELVDREEITWWYFEKGKAYRFVGGRLTEEVTFEPVTPFDDDDGMRR